MRVDLDLFYQTNEFNEKVKLHTDYMQFEREKKSKKRVSTRIMFLKIFLCAEKYTSHLFRVNPDLLIAQQGEQSKDAAQVKMYAQTLSCRNKHERVNFAGHQGHSI